MPERLRGALEESDLVQDAMVKVSLGLPSLDAIDAPRYRGWLRTILRRVGIDVHRAHARMPTSGDEVCVEPRLLGDSHPTPSQEAARREEHAHLQRRIARLPSGQRQALGLYLEGKSTEEIARALGRSASATAGLLKRGLQALQPAKTRR